MKLVHVTSVAAFIVLMSSGVNASTGTVDFKGSIVSASCSLATGEGGDASNIDMGQIANAILEEENNSGETKAKPFSIKLENCSASSIGKTVTAKFNGVPSNADPESFALMGTARGAHLVLTEKDGTKINIGKESKGANIGLGGLTLEFAAKLKGDGMQDEDGNNVPVPIVPGSFNVPVTFELAYN